MIKNLPQGWRVEELGNLVNFIIGKTPSRTNDEYFKGTHLWVSIADIKSKYLSTTKERITDEALHVTKIRKVQKGTLLLSYKLSIGKMAFATQDLYTNEAIAGLDIKSQSIGKEYLYYYLLFADLEKTTDRAVKGRTLNKAKLEQIPILLPPIPQQEKIVKVLDNSSSLVEQQKQLIEKYDVFLKSKFIEMFGDPITNPMGWEVVRVDEIVILQRGYDLPIAEREEGNIDIYGSNGIVGQHSEAKVFGGGIITGRSGTIGNVTYTFDDFWPLNTSLFSKDTKGNNIIYLKYLLDFFKLERFCQGAGVPTLNRNLIHCEMIYKIPLYLQNKFASIVEKIEAIKEKETQKLNYFETLHVSLMDKAFKGEIV